MLLRLYAAVLLSLSTACAGDTFTEGGTYVTRIGWNSEGMGYSLIVVLEPEKEDPVINAVASISRGSEGGPLFVNGLTPEVREYFDDLHGRSYDELDAISCDDTFSQEECVGPRLTVFREIYEDFFRFRDVERGAPAHEFIRESMRAIIGFLESAEPKDEEEAEKFETGDWPLPTLPEMYQ